MKRSYTKSIALCMLAAAAVLVPAVSQASEIETTAKLQAVIAELSTEQQAALLLFVDALNAGSAPSSAQASTPMDTLKAFCTAMVDGANSQNLDVDLIMSYVAEDFDSMLIGDKDSLLFFFDTNKPMVESAGGGFEIDLSEVRLEEADGVISATPVYMQSPFGSYTVTYSLKQEADGVYRIVEMSEF